jgi:hypothetical protein
MLSATPCASSASASRSVPAKRGEGALHCASRRVFLAGTMSHCQNNDRGPGGGVAEVADVSDDIGEGEDGKG